MARSSEDEEDECVLPMEEVEEEGGAYHAGLRILRARRTGSVGSASRALRQRWK